MGTMLNEFYPVLKKRALELKQIRESLLRLELPPMVEQEIFNFVCHGDEQNVFSAENYFKEEVNRRRKEHDEWVTFIEDVRKMLRHFLIFELCVILILVLIFAFA